MRKAVVTIAMVLATLVCAGCAPSGGGHGAPAGARAVKLYGYLIGSPPAGMPAVMDALNRKLKADLNCTMEINYINWADRQSRYPLVLAAGENIDWIFTASWCMYTQQAIRGAFMELTDAMLRKCMPRHYPAVPDEGWEQTRIDGRIYMVPTSTPDRKVAIFLLRADLRRKHGIPEIRQLGDAEPYLSAIRRNEPGMIPMDIESGYDLPAAFSAVRNRFCPPYTWIVSTLAPFIYNYELGSPRAVTELDGAYGAAFTRTAKIMKSWYDKGYFNRNPFANKVRSMEAFAQGRSAVAFGNSQDIQGTIAKSLEQGFDVDIVPSLSSTGTYAADPCINNGIALAANTRNAEKTLAAMDLIMEERSYDYLVYFGIEGVNYVIKDGMIDLPEGLAADKNTYPPDMSGFWFTNKDIFKPLASWPPSYVALRATLSEMLTVTPYAAFSFVPDKVKTEFANVTQVWQQYALPVQIEPGDVDREIAVLKDKLEAAGMRKVVHELQKQMDAFGAALK